VPPEDVPPDSDIGAIATGGWTAVPEAPETTIPIWMNATRTAPSARSRTARLSNHDRLTLAGLVPPAPVAPACPGIASPPIATGGSPAAGSMRRTMAPPSCEIVMFI
jgi:hypothetical protein